jgi:hypothetical protein
MQNPTSNQEDFDGIVNISGLPQATAKAVTN